MSLRLGAMEGVRENLLHRTATTRKHQLAQGTTYENTITSVLDKMKNGEDTVSSAGADLIRKLANGQNVKDSNLAEILADSSDYTNKAALSSHVTVFFDAVSALQKTGEGSLFIKSKAATAEAEEAFDLICKEDGSSFTMDVKQLAQSQKNVGNHVIQKEASGLQVGRKYFDFTMDGKTTSMVIKVAEGDTKGTVMSKIVNAINRADCGVTAQLVSDAADVNQAYIEIVCNATGAPIEGQDRVFYFTNQSSEDVVDQFGLNEMQRPGVDAIFNFNNAEEDTTYMYNSAVIDGRVSVEFKKVTGGPVQVAFDYDYDALSKAVEDYAAAYNSLAKAAGKGSYKTVENYFSQIIKETKNHREELASLGIMLESDGTMHYNNGLLYRTDMSELKETLNDSEKGYASLVQKKAESLVGYMNRLTGKTKKYYGLRAKKSNAHLRELLNS